MISRLPTSRTAKSLSFLRQSRQSNMHQSPSHRHGTVLGNRCRAVLAAATLVALTMAPSLLQAVEPNRSVPAAAGSKAPQLAVYPPEISLNSARDFQSFIAMTRREDGVTLDVTEQVEWSLKSAGMVERDGNILHPVADGTTQLVASFQGSTVEVPVTVENAAVTPAISFKKDVMPVLTRTGCNTGSCHGAARGKDGFNLSLFGFDPEGDHERITREIGIRRVNLGHPEESLLLKKSIGSVPHTGGKPMTADSDYYAVLLEWLRDGAPLDPKDNQPPAVESVRLYPEQAVMEDGSTQQFVAVATYADGTTRDVTRLAAFTTNNSTSAEVDPYGKVSVAARGEAFIMARFDTSTVGSQVLVLPRELNYTAPKITGNYIDQLVGKKLQQLRILPSERCSDEEFLRRATIDITGLLPTEEDYQRFMAHSGPDRRDQPTTRPRWDR